MALKLSDVKDGMTKCKNSKNAWPFIVKHFYTLDPAQKSGTKVVKSSTTNIKTTSSPKSVSTTNIKTTSNPKSNSNSNNGVNVDEVRNFIMTASDRDVLEIRDMIDKRFPRPKYVSAAQEMMEGLSDDEDLGIEDGSLPVLSKSLPQPSPFESLNIGFDIIESLELVFDKKTNYGDGIFDVVDPNEREKLSRALTICQKTGVKFPFNKSGQERLIIKKASEYSDGQKVKVNVKFSKWGPFNDAYGYSCYINRFNSKRK